MRKIRNQGNTVIVVEHDPLIIANADKLIDIGPGAGHLGGNVVASGTLKSVLENKESKTASYLTGREKIGIPPKRSLQGRQKIKIKGAVCHNLQDIDCEFPIGVITCVTGPSGSGKSSSRRQFPPGPLLSPECVSDYHAAFMRSP